MGKSERPRSAIVKKKLVMGIVLLIVVGIVLKFFFFKNGQKIQYTEGLIKKGSIQVTILATGTVQPENRLEIKPPVAGRIEKILVEEGDQVKKGQVLAWMSSTERAALIDSARSQGVEELKRWEEIYKTTPIIAPISGMIIKKSIETGQTFTTNDAVLVMSNRLTIKAQVDETDLAQIRKDQKCEVRLDSYPDEKIDSKVERIAYEAKTVNNVTTYIIDVLPINTPDFMRSGMTANITFYVKNKENALVIPTEYIVYEDGKPFALVKQATGDYQKVVIKTGDSEGKQTEILSGLNEGDTVALKIIEKVEQKSSPFMPMRQNKKNSNGGTSSGAGTSSGQGRQRSGNSVAPPPGH